MTPRARRWLRYIAVVVIVVAAAAFVGQAFMRDLPALREAVEAPGPLFFLGAAASLALMAYFPLVWFFVLRGVGIDMPLRRVYRIWWVSNMGKYVPGKAWMVAGRVYMGRHWGKLRVLESMAWEFYVGLSSALLAGMLFFVVDDPFPGYRWPIVVVALASLAPVIWPELVRAVLRRPLRWLRRGDWSAPTRMHRTHLVTALVVATGSWMLWGVVHGWMLAGIGIEASYWALTGAFAMAWVFGYVIILLPAGLGAREAGIQFLLGPLLVPGGAALFAIVSRAMVLIAETAAFGVGVLLGALRPDPEVPVPGQGGPVVDPNGAMSRGSGEAGVITSEAPDHTP